MHLLERYASSCGVKIGEPYIYESYFPITSNKYISFQPFSKQSKNYDYWQEVIDIASPYLKENGIDIVQIGAKDDKRLNGTIFVSGQTSIPQAAYIIKNSILHFGADSFGVHIASGFSKKILALYSNNNIENVKPYWSKDEDVVLLKADSDQAKPSYSLNENPKNINKIKIEKIAKSLLDLLNIKYSNIPETLYIGEGYNNKTLEVVPDRPININSINLEHIIIRMDYFFNEQVLNLYLQNKKCIILTNKPINIELLKAFKKNISQVVYFIEQDNDANFVKNLKYNAIPYALISYLDSDSLNKFKLNYMDYGLIVERKLSTKVNIDEEKLKNAKFKSSKILISSEGQFNSKYDWINKSGDKAVDSPTFWEENEHFYIFSS
jgi:hypothetical protein